ncbi:MAG: trigger factor [Actinomycetota bacterium]
MKSTVSTLDDNRVKLTVEVDESEFDSALDETFRKIAKEVRIPGFRPGKAPRRILEARIGPEVARGEALRDAIPDYYGAALREHLVDAIAPPEIDITDGEEQGPVVFDAVVEVRPSIEVDGYDGLQVELPSPVASDDEVDAQVDRVREQYADLNEVDRPAIDGDHVLMDINGSQDGEEIGGLTAQDYSYEVGIEALVVELDENLRGSKPGDILEFGADHPSEEGATLDFRVLVKAVREKVLPELTDEWVAENTEFESAEAMRADTVQRLSTVRSAQARSSVRDRVATALRDLADVEPPEPMVQAMMEDQLQNLAMSLQAQGMQLEQWLAMTGTTQDDFRQQLQDGARSGAIVDLALRAVASAESLAPTDEEVDAELADTASRLELEVAEVRERLDEADGLMGITAELTKRKALDWLLDRAELVDEDSGEPIDRTLLDPPEETTADDIEAADGPPIEDVVAAVEEQLAADEDTEDEVTPEEES